MCAKALKTFEGYKSIFTFVKQLLPGVNSLKAKVKKLHNSHIRLHKHKLSWTDTESNLLFPKASSGVRANWSQRHEADIWVHTVLFRFKMYVRRPYRRFMYWTVSWLGAVTFWSLTLPFNCPGAKKPSDRNSSEHRILLTNFVFCTDWKET